MIFPLLPVFLASLGASPAFLGLIEGLADAVASLLKLLSGYAADRLRRRKPLVLFGYGVASLVRPLVALATSPWHVLAVRVTDRIGKGVRSTPRDALIAASVSHEEAGRAFGFHNAMDHAGAVAGPLLATGLLALGWPLRSVFWVAVIPGIAATITVATVREPPALAPSPAQAAVKQRAHFPSAVRSYFAILLLFSLGNSSDAFLLLRAKDLGVAVPAIPLLWAIFHVAKLVSSYLGGSWSDRIARPKLITLGWLVYAATYFAFGVATKSWHAWGLFVVYGTYYGLTEPVEKALVKDLVPGEAQGRAYGFYNFIIGISAVPAGLLTGWLWQAHGPSVALSTGAGLAAVASAALMIWSRTAKLSAS